MTRQLTSITVAELIAELEQYNPNTKVVFSYNYGDHWNTEIAGTIGPYETEEVKVKWSGYHRKFKVIDEESEDWAEGEDAVCLGSRAW